jgi:hypothetical protein
VDRVATASRNAAAGNRLRICDSKATSFEDDMVARRSRRLFHLAKTLAAGGQNESLVASHACLDPKSHLQELRANT